MDSLPKHEGLRLKVFLKLTINLNLKVCNNRLFLLFPLRTLSEQNPVLKSRIARLCASVRRSEECLSMHVVFISELYFAFQEWDF